MSHEVETMMYADSQGKPWHGLGTPVADGISIDQAIVAAGLDWTVTPFNLEWVGPGGYRHGTEHYVQVRDSDNKVLGLTKAQYTPVQNREAFNFFQQILDDGQAVLDTAGSLKGGRLVWVLARLTESSIEVGEGDRINNYCLLTTSHDGTTKLTGGFVGIRAVCANTVGAALNSASSNLFKIKHVKGIHKTLDGMKQSLDVARRDFVATAEVYTRLAESPATTDDVKEMVKVVFKLTDEELLAGNKTSSQIITNFHTGRGSELESAAGTAWGAYNALTEFTSHHYGSNADSRLQSLWYGANRSKNEQALSFLREKVGV